MPIRDMLVEQMSSSILEPVSKELTAIVLRQLGMKEQFANNIYITNEYTKASLTSDEHHNAMISKDRCDVKMTASLNPSEQKWDVSSFKYTQAYGVPASLSKIMRPVFQDRVAGIYLTEHQVPCTMTLDFSLKFKNRESAFMAISVINNTSLKDSVINYHDLSYYYPLSTDMMTSLYQLYLLRKASLSNLDFGRYLIACTNGAAQYLQQRTGPLFEIIIKRLAMQSMGVLEYNENTPIVEEQDRGVDRFVVNFTYTLQFARPDALRLAFPVVVCNQMVPTNLLRAQEQSYLATVYGVFQEKSVTAYLRDTLTNIQVVVRLPEYDDFRPPLQPVGAAGFTELFDAALLLDDASTTTIDLLNLGSGVRLHPTMVTIMKLHGQEIFDTTGLYNVAVYCNDLPVDLSMLSIDDNLVVTLQMQNKNKRYHLVISEATNLHYLDRRWLDTLIEYRTFFPITIIRNLQLLIDQKYCYIDNSNRLLMTINRAICNFQIDAQIAALIAAGHLTHYAYSYTTTAEQFAAYLMNTISPCSRRLAYDEYVALCLAQGVLVAGQLATGYIRTRDGYAFLPQNVRGATSSFNVPLRVELATIKIAPGRA